MTTKSLDLKEEVIEELAFDPRITADDIAVTVQDGIVTLRGTVPSFNEKWEAEDAVKRVRGVRGIADELVVDLPATHARNDTDIALAIEHRLASNAIVPRGVKFVVKDGHVILSGEVTWYYQSQEAAYEARRVVGVRDVTNSVAVKPETFLSVDEVKRKIHGELQRMADVDANGIGVAIAGRTVTLTGSVRTWVERDKAAQAAWNLPGVTHVDNFIGVAP